MNDICDRASQLEQQQRDRAIEEARHQKHQPEQALDGDVIICACCGIPIPLERLKAKPTASLCVPCQTAIEGRGHTK